jgi:hypothetical protein
VLFALELDRRVRAAGIPVRSVLAHPGYSSTNLQSSGPTDLVKQLMKGGQAYEGEPGRPIRAGHRVVRMLPNHPERRRPRDIRGMRVSR